MKLLISFLIVFLSWQVQATCTAEITVDGGIGASTLDYIQRSKAKAIKQGCTSILTLINTPGGNLHSTRLIVEEILNSEIPFLCLVYPSGAHAGSAGAIILQACHIAGAMTATNIGAATPITGGGKDMQEDLRKKMLNDTVSWLEGITKLRERNLKFSEEIITEAKAVDSSEALKLGAIDYLAKSKESFLEFAAGKTVSMEGDKKQKVEVGSLVPLDKDLRAKALDLISDPQISYLIFMGSLGLLYFELTHPGTIAPGVVGGIGLVLSLISMHKLNVEWGAVALLLLGIGLMIGEAFVPSFGILGFGGVVSFVLGSVFLFDPENSGYSLSWSIILPTALVLGSFTMLLSYLAFQTRNVKNRGEYNELLSKEGRVVKLNKNKNSGLIEINGETWKFKTKESLSVGDQVKVVSYKGLTLEVEKS